MASGGKGGGNEGGGGGGGGGAPSLPPGLEDMASQGQEAPSQSPSSAGQVKIQSDLILGAIGNQVTQLLAQAKNDSEVKVKRELGKVHSWIQAMDERLDGMMAKLDLIEAPRADVEQAAVAKLLQTKEQQCSKELVLLKQDLHQTILAHNHNADLMKHQKGMLDQIHNEIDQAFPPINPAAIQAQLQKVDAMLKQQDKNKKLEPLFGRLAVLEQRVAAATSFALMGQPQFPMVPPGDLSQPVASASTSKGNTSKKEKGSVGGLSKEAPAFVPTELADAS